MFQSFRLALGLIKDASRLCSSNNDDPDDDPPDGPSGQLISHLYAYIVGHRDGYRRSYRAERRESRAEILAPAPIAWAVNNLGHEISWNHLKGDAVIINYQHTTSLEYDAYAFHSHSVGPGASTDGVPGRLLVDGSVYVQCFDKLLLDFYASGSDALSDGGVTIQIDTGLTLHAVSANLRQDSRGPDPHEGQLRHLEPERDPAIGHAPLYQFLGSDAAKQVHRRGQPLPAW